MSTVTAPTLLTNDQAAEYLGLKPQTLAAWRHHRREGQPPYIQIAAKVIRYRADHLEQWLADRTVTE
jgi:hypothetical protein